MDPISKALERAKQNQSVSGWVNPSQAGAVALPQDLPSAGNTVELDPKVLHNNSLLSGDSLEDPAITDKYRLLRTKILQIMRANSWKSIGITSPGAKAGKSVTSCNLALSIAREGNHQAVLVDADIRKPTIAEYMGIESELALPDYLLGRSSLPQVLVGISNWSHLSVLCGAPEGASGLTPEYLKSSRMSDIFASAMTNGYPTLYVVDLPPALIGDDVLAVSMNLDCLLVVVDESSTTADDLKQTLDLLGSCNIVGTVLNRSTEKPTNHGSYYQYYRAGASEEAPEVPQNS
ncbi:MAG: hypothetical protein CMQ49_00515 [Gammaproteobacteria bacterium]|nr:hypothetical protein [Gammaproteobacteria bacterium]|tara:strand:- start:1888 stop:2760 length:873 start_codon:yes stop_codon:yes gene_type:complete